MVEHPLVSVVIPVYNAEKYVGAAVESVLAQTYPRIQIITVDDGSTDNSLKVLQNYPQVTVLSRPNGGIGAARNTGVAYAHGDLLAFLDSDDLWMANKLVLQVDAMLSQDAVDMPCDMVFGFVQQFISPDLDESVKRRIVCPPEPMRGYVCGTMLIRRELFHKVGAFSETLRVGEFVDWYARAKTLGLGEVMLPNVLLHRRLHSGSQSYIYRANQQDFAVLLKAKLDRERDKR
jgi:glycosyltransferase involved in cell wall biosynthesis